MFKSASRILTSVGTNRRRSDRIFQDTVPSDECQPSRFRRRGPVTIETSNGRIEVKESTGTLQLSTSNGKIIIEKSIGTVQASSSNGAIQLLGCGLEGKCRLATSNGSISVSFSERNPIGLEAKTSNGSIQFNEADVDVSKKSKSQLTGVVFGAAKGVTPSASLDLETSNGSIKIMTDAASTVPG